MHLARHRAWAAKRLHDIHITGRKSSIMISVKSSAAQPVLHAPHKGTSSDPIFDLLYSAVMQAQQVTNCYNNCLVTSVSVIKAAELLEQQGYKIVFGHLASNRAGINAEVPHVWVTYKDQLIMDATLNDAMPTEDLFNFKSQLRYVPGPAANPMQRVGLPVEAPNQETLEKYVNNVDEYISMLSRAEANTPQASAYLLYISLTQGLAGAKDEIMQQLAK